MSGSKHRGLAELEAMRLTTELSKREPRRGRRDASGAAIAGAGGVTATAGLVGGGIPGFRSDSDTIANVRQGPWRQRTGAALSSGRGGIFGYRTDAHQGALNRFEAERAKHAGVETSRSNMFLRGRGNGKIKPEVDIIRHLKRGRRASHVALVGGAGITVFGAHRTQRAGVSKSTRDTERYHGALLGTGATAAAASIGGERALRYQGRKWSAREAGSRAAAAKIIPNMKPEVSDGEVTRNKRILAGKSKLQAEAAGMHRGAAAQERYFASVYNGSAKIARRVRSPALATAAVGGGGLLLARRRDVKKIDTTMDERTARREVGRYGTRGPLPKGLDRPTKMRAYEARYVAAGGPRGEKWKRTANRAEHLTTASIVGAGTAAGVDLAARSARVQRLARSRGIDPGKVRGKAGVIGLGSAAVGAGGELLRRAAERRRASYSSSPAGVAASALRRMRDYTPD